MMACCTTISPVNSGRKRTSGGLFDLPQTSKRRRAPSTTLFYQKSSVNGSSSSINSNNNNSNSFNFLSSHQSSHTSKSSTMLTTASPNSSFIIDANQTGPSVFQLSPSTSQNNGGGCGGENNENNTPLSPQQLKDNVMERICSEAKRLIKRRQMSMANITIMNSNETIANNRDNNNNNTVITKSNSTSNILNNSTTTTTTTTATTPESKTTNTTKIIPSKLSTTTTTTTTSHNDIPLFSMNQVNTICDRMMREREQTIRAEYDKILAQKLCEQYDTFVKFTHDQIQRRIESSQCTYVS